MSKIIYVTGGLGRIISSLPSLMKYEKNNKDSEWYICIPEFDFVTLGIPELQERTINPNTRGIWEKYFKNAKEVVSPEPYLHPNFYNKKINLVEAFDEITNDTSHHSDLNYENLILSESELFAGKEVIYSAYQKFGKEKSIVINPYGSSAFLSKFGICDNSNRSFSEDMLLTMIDFFSNYYNVIVMIQNHLLPEEKSREKFYHPNPDIHVREWMGVISQVDYFIGCDSSGQHIARSLGTPGSVIMGGTSAINFSYSDYFQIFCKKEPVYSPMRISPLQSDLADRLNVDNMKYDSSEILEICEKIKIKVDAIEM